MNLPLADDEWGTFDVVHARFLLEHVTDPLAVVRSMVRAARPGGRIVLEDDDHDTLRLWPEAPDFMHLWQAYFETYARQGKEPYVGRHLISLLHEAGAKPRQNRCPFFGTCAGNPNFEAMAANFIGIIEGARKEIVSFGLSDDRRLDEGFEALRTWMKKARCGAVVHDLLGGRDMRPGESAALEAASIDPAEPARTPVAESQWARR